MFERFRNLFKRKDLVELPALYESILMNSKDGEFDVAQVILGHEGVRYFDYRGYDGRVRDRHGAMVIDLQMGDDTVSFIVAPKLGKGYEYSWLRKPNATNAVILKLAL